MFVMQAAAMRVSALWLKNPSKWAAYVIGTVQHSNMCVLCWGEVEAAGQ